MKLLHKRVRGRTVGVTIWCPAFVPTYIDPMDYRSPLRRDVTETDTEPECRADKYANVLRGVGGRMLIVSMK